MVRFLFAGGIALVSASVCGSALAQGAATATPAPGSLADLAARFGARPLIRQISLSPDGNHVALVANAPDGSETVATADLEAGKPPTSIMRSPGADSHLTGCFWPTDQRLVCRATIVDQNHRQQPVGFTRLITLNADGSDLKLLTAKKGSTAIAAQQNGGVVIDETGGGKAGSVLVTRDFIPERTNENRVTHEGRGVELVDVTSLDRDTVEQPRMEAAAYIADGSGVVRLRADADQSIQGYAENYNDWFYRKPGVRDWLPLNRVTIAPSGQSSGFRPVAVDSALNVAYGFDAQNGLKALYRVKLDGSNVRELVFANPVVDVDNVIEIGRSRRGALR